jgi:hypothetical protein
MRIDEISIHEDTDADQLAAVQRNGLAIQWIKNPSDTVQLAAVKKDVGAIKHIENPSDTVQLSAVQQNGLAIEYIENPTPEMQLAAVQRHSWAIYWIKNPSPELLADHKVKRSIIKSMLELIKIHQLDSAKLLVDYLRDHNVNWPELDTIEPILKENRVNMRINELITEAPINTVNVEKGWRKRELGVKPPTDFKPLGKVGNLTVGIIDADLYGVDIGVLWKDGTLCAKMELAKYMISSKAFWAVNAAFADERLRGRGAIPKIYAFLVNNGFDLRADSDQSPGGQYIWAKLSQDPSVTVYAAKHDYKKDTWEYTAVEGVKQLQGNFYLYRDEMDEELKYIENEMESLRAIREKLNDTYIKVTKKTKDVDRPSPKMTELMNQYNALSNEIDKLDNEYRELRYSQDDEAKHDMFLLAVPDGLSIPAPEGSK